MVAFNRTDLEFVLTQIKLAETGQDPVNPHLSFGLRQVDGNNNSIVDGQSAYGAADRPFSRLTDAVFQNNADGGTMQLGPGAAITNNNYGIPGSVADSDPRTISNLIVDQSTNNPAAQAAADQAADALGTGYKNQFNPAQPISTNENLFINNITPDNGLSAPFNTWFTLFGQFFDHGLDLVNKGGNETVFIPLQPDDPLYVPGSHTNFMVLTRATPASGGAGTNAITPFVDQSQTYTSHPSHQVFLREYAFSVDSDNDGIKDSHAVATGNMLEGKDGGLATWADVKQQALEMLGIKLTDQDVGTIPLLATDSYGRFIPGANGYAQVILRVTETATDGEVTTKDFLVEGTKDGLDFHNLHLPQSYVSPPGVQVSWGFADSGHQFLNDIAHAADPSNKVADSDTDVGLSNSHLLSNASFEADTIAPGSPGVIDDLALGSYEVKNPTGWEITGGPGGVLDPSETATSPTGHTGSNVAFLDAGATLARNTAVSIEKGGVYTLTFNVGDLAGTGAGTEFGGGTARILTADGKVLAQMSLPTPEDGHWSPVTLRTGPISVADDGKELRIEFSHGDGNTGWVLIDDVELKSTTPGAIANNYDNELLDAHFVAGDGRINENIGLTAVHAVFHAEHNRLVQQIKDMVTAELAKGDSAFASEWVVANANLADGIQDNEWNGERLFQAAKFGTETQYQHLVFEEFARKISPAIHLFGNVNIHLDPAVMAEFAHAVYRFGHSMLDENINLYQVGPDGKPVLGTDGKPQFTAIGLIDAFTNPEKYAQEGADKIALGALNQVGNEIDEFVTGALRNNLLGLPLDLAALNITRGREMGVAPLNLVRNEIYSQTHDAAVKPYENWTDFGHYLKHEASLVNFVAAYGTHPSIVNATTLAEKRAAATALVELGADGFVSDLISADEIKDAYDFMHSKGAYANKNVSGATAGTDDPRLLHQVNDNQTANLGKTSLTGSVNLTGYTTASDATLTITVDGGAHDISLTAGMTVTQIATAINAANAGVTAVMTNGHLQLVSNGLGAGHTYSVSGDAKANLFGNVIMTGSYIPTWSTGSVTGVDHVDLWIGGLAEKQNLFGGLLGSTFDYIFRIQMENLQDGDRLYYLPRLEGTHFAGEIENNSFAEMIQHNLHLKHLSAAIFMTPEYTVEASAIDPDKVDTWTRNPENHKLLVEASWVKNGAGFFPGQILSDVEVAAHWGKNGNGEFTDLKTGEAIKSIHFLGDDNFLGNTMVLGGTDGADFLQAGNADDDTVWGDGGNDWIDGGNGADNLFGGDGNDVITDTAGDDVIHGDAGDDWIDAGIGDDIVFGSDGNDTMDGGKGLDEIQGGQGNDVIKGGEGDDEMQGNEGDDWVEGGQGGDLIVGDGGAPTGQLPLYDSNDVLIGGSWVKTGPDGHPLPGPGNDLAANGGDRMQGFNGDDCMIGGGGFNRFEGRKGFDWASYEFDRHGVSVDMTIKDFILDSPPTSPDAIRDRFIETEGLSGSSYDDVLKGTNDAVADPTNELQNVNLITNLDTFFSPDNPVHFSGGNIILGGGGSDRIIGGSGDDIIDGDAYLHVELNKGQIVREILDGGRKGDVDTAVFSDIGGNYAVGEEIGGRGWKGVDAEGFISVVHLTVGPGAINDGVDKIRNIERLEFQDKTVNVVDLVFDAHVAKNELPQGTVTIKGAVQGTPLVARVGDTLEAVADLQDLDPDPLNPQPGSVEQVTTQTYRWQYLDPARAEWVPITGATGSTYKVADFVVGQPIRVVASFVDNLGFTEHVNSAQTAAVTTTPGVNTAPFVVPQQGVVGLPDTTVLDTAPVHVFLPVTTVFNDAQTAANNLIYDVTLANGAPLSSIGLQVVDTIATNGALLIESIDSKHPLNVGVGPIDIRVSATDRGPGTALSVTDTFTMNVVHPSPGAQVVIDGSLQDGYIAGATVFMDSNGDGVRQSFEAQTVTDALGQFSLIGRPGQLIAFGGSGAIDISTGKQFNGIFKAPAGSTVITPLTTILTELMGLGMTKDHAQQVLCSALGLGNGTDVTHIDPIAGMSDPAQAAAAKALFVAGAEVLNTIALIEAAVPNADAMRDLIDVIKTGAPLDLHDPATIQGLLTMAGLDGQIATETAKIIAEGNGALVTAAATTTDVQQLLVTVTAASMVAKGATADALNQAFTLDEVVAVRSHFTGKGLHDAIEDEKSHVGDVNGDGHNDALPNQAPTAVVLSSMQSLAENTVIGAGIKVADIAVTDDGYGVNRLALTGADKASFAIRDGANGKELWYIGASPDFETKSAYDVTVTVDDMAVGATPDASADFHLAITDVNDAPAAAVLSNRQTLAENTVIGAGMKVADIAITDDGLGLNQLGLTGADKASFEIRDGAGGKELWYVGASPDYETKKAYDVTVTVDDTTVGMTPDASADFHLTITDVYEAPPVVVDDDKVMKGGRGNDNLHGGSGHDSIYGGRGHDMLQGSDGNDQLYGEDGNDRLYGGSGQDSLRGGDGDDRLDGGAGGDQMWGGRGNDIYVVDNAGDRVVESPNQGYDTVNASISYSLANTSVERLVLTGGDNLNGSGNSLNNALVGNAGNNVLKGGAGSDNLSGGSGNDTLYGGAGTDRLTGGAGRDVFVFEKGGGHDTVTDYRDGQDRIDVSRLSGVHTLADLTLWQVGHDVMIAHGTDVLVLDDVSISVLHQSDFIF